VRILQSKILADALGALDVVHFYPGDGADQTVAGAAERCPLANLDSTVNVDDLALAHSRSLLSNSLRSRSLGCNGPVRAAPSVRH
jgi:hypothetical protein